MSHKNRKRQRAADAADEEVDQPQQQLNNSILSSADEGNGTLVDIEEGTNENGNWQLKEFTWKWKMSALEAKNKILEGQNQLLEGRVASLEFQAQIHALSEVSKSKKQNKAMWKEFNKMKERFGIMEQKMEEYANEKIVLEGGQPTYPQEKQNEEMEQQEDENEKGANEQQQEQQQEDEIGDERGDFVVEKVVKEKVLKNGKIRYFVKWEDYISRWNSWVPRENVAHLDVVKEYEAAKKAAQTAVVLGTSNANGTNMHGMDITIPGDYHPKKVNAKMFGKGRPKKSQKEKRQDMTPSKMRVTRQRGKSAITLSDHVRDVLMKKND